MTSNKLSVSHDKRETPFNFLYYCLFFIFYNYHFMRTTMFYQEHYYVYADRFQIAYDFLTNILLTLTLLTIVFGKTRPTIKIFAVATIILSIFHDYYRDISSLKKLTVFFLLIICSQGKSLKTICRIFLVCGWFWVVISFAAYKYGYISDVVFEGKRHAWGSIYCTDLACHFLTLSMMMCIYKNGKLKLPGYLSMVALLVLNLLYLKAKVGFLCLFLVLVLTFIHQFVPMSFWKNNRNWSPIKCFGICSWMLFAAVTIYMTITYSTDPNLWLNKFGFLGTFRSRFNFGKMAFDKYPLQIWGTYIAEKGNGGVVGGGTVEDYFFLDISYVRIIMLEGIIMFSITLLLFTGLQIKLARKDLVYPLMIVVIFLLDCAVEHHMLELAYDILPFLLFANLDCICYHEKPMDRQIIANNVNEW